MRAASHIILPRSDGNCIDVWDIRLDDHLASSGALTTLLRGHELQRARRLHDPLEQERFIVRRALRRLILSLYTDRDPDRLSFGLTSYGRPFLTGEPAESTVHFSHACRRGVSLLAVAFDQEIGVDLEYVDPACDIETVSQLLSPQETRALELEPLTTRRLAFFRCWTRKEAVLKAAGTGLSTPLNSFTVPCSASCLDDHTVTGPDTGSSGREWHLSDVAVALPYVACLVGERPCTHRRIRYTANGPIIRSEEFAEIAVAQRR